MSRPIIEVHDVAKKYRLGRIGMSSLRDEIQRFGSQLRSGRGSNSALPGAGARKDEGKDFWALKGVSFEVQQGEVLGVIGHNGAGKSTLLKVLSRITEPTTGEIRMRGRIASLLEVGTGFHPELSGRENIYLNGAILGMRKQEIQSKFDEIVDFAGVDKFIDTPVKRYSSGMYVRLAFAVAAHLEPEILIVDEVLAVGDQEFQQKCLGKMQDVATNSGRTILFVSHHMSAIRRLCDKCIVLYNGQASDVMDVELAVERYNDFYRKDTSLHCIETADWPRDHRLGSEVKILSIQALGDPPLAYGEPLEIEVTVDVQRSVSGVSLGLGFDSIDGGRIMTLDSDAQSEPVDLPAGRHTLNMLLDFLPLQPGQYSVHASLISGAHYHDMLLRFATWEVTTSNADKVSDRGFGGCRIPPQLTVRPVEFAI